jgi:hypothetical protein
MPDAGNDTAGNVGDTEVAAQPSLHRKPGAC